MRRAPLLFAPLPRLRVGLSIAIVCGVVLVGARASIALAERGRSELIEAKRAAASMMVRVLGASLAAPLDFGDDVSIGAKIDDLRQDPQVLYAGVWRADDPEALAKFGRQELRAPTSVPQIRIFAETMEIVEVITDPTSRPLGMVTVGFTLRPELERYESTRNRILAIVGLLAAAVSAALILITRWQLHGRRSHRAAPDSGAPTGLSKGLLQHVSRGADGPGTGDLLGQYQLLTCVGQGGMGRVWAARQMGAQLQRLVAVKTVLEGDSPAPELRSLFMDEARIALLLRHPNVCGVHELGEHEGTLYQVMEWCDGVSLRQVLDRLPGGRMDIKVAVRVIAKVSAGLHAAHELEDEDGVRLHVVHRDVSPQNILIATNGQVQVTDFGVAKAHGQLHRPTATGEMKGKISYMSPEQVMGQSVDRRSDVFALGSILYEATTGKSPFAGEGALSTLYQLLAQPVSSPKVYVSDYPDELAAIVIKAMSRDPEDRYQTAEQLNVTLEGWLASERAIVTEHTIAELVTSAAGGFIREKAKRLQQVIDRLGQPDPLELAALRSREEIAGSRPASVTLAPPRLTVPAGPRARKPRAVQ